MNARRRTAAGVYGTDAVNELAELAIDMLCDPPVQRASSARGWTTRTARVDWDLIEEGRTIMERHGIHWRALKADNERTERRS